MPLSHLSVADIKKNIWQRLIFFCKNEACVKCTTHKRYNPNLVTVGGTPLHSHAWTSPKFPLAALGILKRKRIIRETQYFFFRPDREETLYIFTTHIFSLTIVVELELAELLQCTHDFMWHLYFIDKYLVWSGFSGSKYQKFEFFPL